MHIYSRTIQRTLTLTTGIMCREPKLYTGKGSLYEVIRQLKKTACRSIMVATTPGTIRRGTLKLFFEELEHAGIQYVIYQEIGHDPTIECIEAMRAKYIEEGCEAMVAIGGGSVIDASKAVLARTVRPHLSVRRMRGVMKVLHPLPDLYAVPTTAGTGSEATAASVVTDTVNGVHYKYSINDPCLIPRYAVLDPMLSKTLPPAMTAATGMDALTHAVEAYTNRFASSKVKQMSEEAVRLIFANLPKAYEDGTDLEARNNMLMGSYYAGIAFTNNFVGYVHALAHALGGIYGLSHGRTNAIILPYVMEQFGEAVHAPLAELARVSDVAAEELEDETAAEAFIKAIRDMNEAMCIPDKIEELRREDYDEIIRRAIKEANPTYPVPVIWGRNAFAQLLDKLVQDATDDNILY